MVTSQYCLDQSKDCAHQARAATSRKEKEVLFGMARAWETLARHAARLEHLKENPASTIDDA